MEDKEKQNDNIDKSATSMADKSQLVTGKSFLTVGPTLHYSHSNVLFFWFLSLIAFGLCCSFWSKITTGSFLYFGPLLSFQNWFLGRFTTAGVSIFEYPWQILVLGLLMAVFAVAPVLVSQLMCFRYSLLFVVLIALVANLPGFALFVLVSCFAASTRPLRFRSRFTAIALCLVPQLIYWGFFGGDRGAEPIVWGFSFTPWICAWLVSLVIAGFVISIGHFTRYRPGLILASTCLTFVATIIIFKNYVGFDELDYQLYIAENNPEQIDQFRSHSITKALDDTITNKQVIEDLVKAYFLPTEPVPLRNRLKQTIIDEIKSDYWPWWFAIGPELRYQEKREQLLQQYKNFIDRRSRSKRMPVALYFKAILMEMSPDIKNLEQSEELTFYNDYPGERAREVWHQLYRVFPESPESLEARWRIAMHWAGLGRFSHADGLLEQAEKMLPEKLELLISRQTQTDSFLSSFRPPAESAMTAFKLEEIGRRTSRLRSLISPQNRTENPQSEQRLAEFVMLNPHRTDYAAKLDKLLSQMTDKDPLKDNVLLAQTMLVADEQLRADKLAQLNGKFLNTDGGMLALYELALLQRRFWSQLESNSDQKKKLLAQTHETMKSFLALYPDSIYSSQIKKILSDLPKVD